MNIYAASLALECNFDKFPASSLKIAGASLSLVPSIPLGAIASLALECNFDIFPPVSLKIAGASMSLIARFIPATIASLSISRADGYVQLIDLKKGTAIMMTRNT